MRFVRGNSGGHGDKQTGHFRHEFFKGIIRGSIESESPVKPFFMTRRMSELMKKSPEIGLFTFEIALPRHLDPVVGARVERPSASVIHRDIESRRKS